MDKRTYAFLRETLGTDGAAAMKRAITKDPRLEYYLVPRTCLSWALTKNQFEGSFPGTDIYVQFVKSEDGYTGSIGKDNNPVTKFTAPDEFNLVAELLTAFDYKTGVFEGTDRTLVSLGKSVDALLRARMLTNKFIKGGVDLPGTTAKPFAQGTPEEPLKPVNVQAGKTKPKLPKLPILKVERKELSKSCKTCDGIMFKSEKFVGCMCWRDLAKHATTTMYSDGAVVEFSKEADRSIVNALYRELSHGE